MNNNAAKAIIHTVKQNMADYKTMTSAERELAIVISELKEPAALYILLTKYFYLSHNLSARSALILYYYVLKVAQQKNDKAVMDAVGDELKTWLPLIQPALQSPLILKVLLKAWDRTLNRI